MKLVALYKTWDGGEFVDASLASIYDHVDAVVMIHSDISWLGEHGNTVRPLAVEWCEENDRAGKVHHVDVSISNQEAQYAAGLDYIKKHDLGDVVMVVDADEIWEGVYIENAKRQIHDQPFVAYRSNMHTYLKTPFYRVDPPCGSPTTFLREPRYLTESARGHRAPAVHLSDVWMHHYTYVRESRDAVERKLHQSAKADGSEMVIPGWMEAVYDRLPSGQNLHAFARWVTMWQRVEKIWLSDIPPAMRAAKLMKLWVPHGLGDTILDGEANAIHRLAQGRRLAIDLGSYHGLTAMTLGLACDQVHSFDLYADTPPDSFSDTLRPDRYHTLMQTHSFEENCQLAARFGNITFAKLDTVEAGKRWAGDTVDVLFVDADHSASGTRANVEAWLPHMPRGGRIIFHDDNDIHPDLQALLNEFRSDSRFRFFNPGDYAGSLAVCEAMK